MWAAGYNWLQSNEQSSDVLIARIHEALDFYSKSTVMIPEGRVIIITHSMGGLVARRAAQKAPGLILGILHGVQPVTGAPVVYRRLRAGTERGGAVDAKAAILSSIIGWSASDTSPVLGNAPGPLELLPTKNYPSGWLTAGFKGNVKNIDFVRWPASNPYAEIYSKRVQDVWWGMVDEQLLDPAGMAVRKRSTPLVEFQKALRKAETFHDTIKLECHPVTYAYYGADAKYAAFSQVQWLTTDQVAESWKPLLPAAPVASHDHSGRVAVSMPNDYVVTFSLGDRVESKQNGDRNSGDATVPFFSGAQIKDGALLTCQMVGFDHQNSYNDGNVRDLTVYCVAKIVQHAVAVETLPQSKGK